MHSLLTLPEQQQEQLEIKKLLIIGSSVSGFLLILVVCVFLRVIKTKSEGKGIFQCIFCIGKPVVEADLDPNPPPLSVTTYVGETQVYRLSELKDATHGFKEFSELSRESFGFVYKAVLLNDSK